jgi:dTDP-glucose pyrophosphorylase
MNIKEITILKDDSIGKALKVIDKGGVQIALVVDEHNTLLGTLSDGDIRRGLLDKKDIDSSILDLYNKKSITAIVGISKSELNKLSVESEDQIDKIPLVDSNGKLVDIYFTKRSQYHEKYSNTIVLMVGGLGTRLRPLTNNTPKPMLHVGGRPILQTIIKGFSDSNFTNITMCLGYKSNVIQDYFQDGSDFGVNIDYIVEEERMGTAGALTLLREKLNKPLFVMNGDLLTNVNFEEMLDFHESNNSKATMCVREYDIEVPYGVVKVNNEKIVSIEEKPAHSFFVNAGIYLLEPECLDLIPGNEFYDMPSLFEELIKNNRKTTSFPLKEYWMDIGRIADYERANSEYSSFF